MPVAHLTDRAVIELAGPDAVTFLNGLVTQDVTRLPEGTARYAGLLSPQGKALFDMFVVGAADGALLLDVAAARAGDLVKRLTLYRLRAAVTIHQRDELVVLAGWGNSPAPDGAWPDPRSPAMGWRRIAPASDATTDISAYQAHRLSHGIPDTVDIGVDQLLWLEANGDLLNGVSFTKGCYIGQENTARMHHRHKVRKRICRVTSTEGLAATGTPIMAGDREAGHLLSVMGDQGLALLRMEYLETGAPLTAGGEPLRADIPEGLASSFAPKETPHG